MPRTFAQQIVKVLGVAEDDMAALVEIEALLCDIGARTAACRGV